MAVHSAGDIFGGSAKFHCYYSLSNEVRRARAYHMHPEYSVGLCVGNDFYDAFSFIHAARASIGEKEKRASLVGNLCGLSRLFGKPNCRDFGPRINDARNNVVIHMPGLAG